MIEENQTFDVEQKLNDAITCIDSMQYEQAIRLCDECITYLEATKRQNSNKERLNKRDSLVKQKSLKKNTSTTSMSSIFTSSIKSSLLRKRDDSTSETNDSISETNDSTPEIDKQLAKAYFHRNLAKNLLHRDYITVIDFTKAIDLFSQYVNAYLNRARAYYKLKNFEAALDDLNKAIEYDPKNFKAYYYRGKVYYGLERYKEARTDFLETRNLDPEFKKVYRHLIMTLYCLDLDETALAEATDAIRLYPELKKDLEKQHLKSVQEKINRQTFSNQLIIGKLTYKTSGLNTKLRLKKDDLLRQQSTSSKLFIKKMKKSDTRFFQKMLDQPTSKFPGLCLIHIKDTFSAEEVEKLEEQQVILSLPHLKEALENPDSWKQRYYLKYLKAGIEQLLLAWTGNNLKNESVVFTLDEMALPQLKILLENTKTSSSKTRKIYKELQKNHSQDEALKNILNAWKKGEVKDKKITTDSLLPSYKTNLDELKKALTPLNDALNFKQASSSKHKKNKHHKQTQHKSESPATKTDYDSTLLKIRLITQRPPEHLKKQDYNNLIRDLTSLIMRNEGKAEVYYLLASTYTRIKEHGLALANYDKAYELRTDGTLSTDTEGKLLANRGFTKYCLNDYVGAERDYQNSIEINKNDFYVHSNLGALYHKLGRYGEALKEYNSAIKLNSAVFLLCRRGLTYICLGIYDKALADFSEALKDLDPKHPKYFDSLINKSIAERNLGLYEDAITTLKIAIKQNPKSADAYWHLGLVYESFKNNKEALENFEKVTMYEPKNASAHYKLATLKMSLKQYLNAITSLDHVIEILLPPQKSNTNPDVNYGENITILETNVQENSLLAYQPSNTEMPIPNNLPTTPEDKLLLAKTFDTLNLAKSSLMSKTFTHFIDIAIAICPEYARAYLNRALVYINQENYDAATRDLDRAIELKLEDPLVYHYRGIIKYQNGNFMAALVDFRRALIFDPNLTEVYSYLIDTLNKLNQKDLAIAFTDTSINYHPNLALELGEYNLESLKKLLEKTNNESHTKTKKLTSNIKKQENALQKLEKKILKQQSTRSKFYMSEMKHGNSLFFKNISSQTTNFAFSGLCLIHLYNDFNPTEIRQLTDQGAILTLDHLENVLINNDSCDYHYFKLLKIGIEHLLFAWKDNMRNPNSLKNKNANDALDKEAIRNLIELLANNQLDDVTQNKYKELLTNTTSEEAATKILELWKMGSIGYLDITFETLLPFYSNSLAIIEKALTPNTYTPARSI